MLVAIGFAIVGMERIPLRAAPTMFVSFMLLFGAVATWICVTFGVRVGAHS